MLEHSDAQTSPEVGTLTECLKWGEPAYVLYRGLFPTQFAYVGKRSVQFGLEESLNTPELRICIALALTYHRRAKSGLWQEQGSEIQGAARPRAGS